jgi:hypothetical protein
LSKNIPLIAGSVIVVIALVLIGGRKK